MRDVYSLIDQNTVMQRPFGRKRNAARPSNHFGMERERIYKKETLAWNKHADDKKSLDAKCSLGVRRAGEKRHLVTALLANLQESSFGVYLIETRIECLFAFIKSWLAPLFSGCLSLAHSPHTRQLSANLPRISERVMGETRINTLSGDKWYWAHIKTFNVIWHCV